MAGWSFHYWICSLVLLTTGCRQVVGSGWRKAPFDDGRDGQGPALAVIGDSLSSAALSSTRLGLRPEPGILDDFFQRVVVFNKIDSPSAFQDRYSEYDKSATASDRPWALREAIAKKENMTTHDIPVFIASRWGATLGLVDHFLAYLQEAYERSPVRQGKKAENVVVMLGGNDFCRGINHAQFTKRFHTKMAQILNMHPRSDVIIAPVFPADQLLKFQFKYNAQLTCATMRQHYCRPLLYKDAKQNLEKINNTMMSYCDQEDIWPDSFEGRMGCARDIMNITVEKKDIAFDCFHLSENGQKKLAAPIRESYMNL